jgi:hypothetical protein
VGALLSGAVGIAPDVEVNVVDLALDLDLDIF